VCWSWKEDGGDGVWVFQSRWLKLQKPVPMHLERDWKREKLSPKCQRQSGSQIIGFSHVNTTIVRVSDFPVYPLLLAQIVSDVFQNVPFCITERDLQGHTLLLDVSHPDTVILPTVSLYSRACSWPW
jgi:hypothetical protein